jgi:hypothetical protein
VRVVWKEFGVSAPVPSAVQDLIKSLGSLNVDLTRRLQTTRAISAHMKGLGWGPGLRVRGPSGRTYSSDKYQGGTSVEIELRACRDFFYDFWKFGLAQKVGKLTHAVIIAYNPQVPIVGDNGMDGSLDSLAQAIQDLSSVNSLTFSLTGIGIG